MFETFSAFCWYHSAADGCRDGKPSKMWQMWRNCCNHDVLWLWINLLRTGLLKDSQKAIKSMFFKEARDYFIAHTRRSLVSSSFCELEKFMQGTLHKKLNSQIAKHWEISALEKKNYSGKYQNNFLASFSSNKHNLCSGIPENRKGLKTSFWNIREETKSKREDCYGTG